MLTNLTSRGRHYSTSVEAKVVCRGQDARSRILEGCDVLARAVGATLGPRGRNVILEQTYGDPRISKDGVTVAKAITLEDPLEELGASLVKQVAQSANSVSGDGTTTATVLTQQIYRGGCEAIAAGLKPVELTKGMREATKAVLDYLRAHSRKISSPEELYHVAKVSANGDEVIGKLIADAMHRVGKDGVVTVTEGRTVNHTVTFTEGYELDRGYVSPYFVTDVKSSKCILDDKPYVLISEDKLNNLKNLLPVLEHCAQQNREILLIADDFDGDVLTTLILNRLRGGLKVCAVKAPSFGDYKKLILRDIALLTGATVLSKEMGNEVASVSSLGVLEKSVISKDKCLIMSAPKKHDTALSTHIAAIRKEIDDVKTTDYEKTKLRERLAKLTSGVAVIHTGGNSEVEVGELKDRVDDALNATRAALTGGVLPGGGSALMFAAQDAISKMPSNNDRDYHAGVEIIRRACAAPLRLIAENAGFEGAVVQGDLLREGKFGFGFDAMNGKVVDMYAAGIIDPTLVVETALKDASSVATMMCTTEAAVYTKPAANKGAATGFPGGNDM